MGEENGDLTWLSVQMPNKMKEILEIEAKENDRSLSSLIRYILKQYLGDYENE